MIAPVLASLVAGGLGLPHPPFDTAFFYQPVPPPKPLVNYFSPHCSSLHSIVCSLASPRFWCVPDVRVGSVTGRPTSVHFPPFPCCTCLDSAGYYHSPFEMHRLGLCVRSATFSQIASAFSCPFFLVVGWGFSPISMASRPASALGGASRPWGAAPERPRPPSAASSRIWASSASRGGGAGAGAGAGATRQQHPGSRPGSSAGSAATSDAARVTVEVRAWPDARQPPSQGWTAAVAPALHMEMSCRAVSGGMARGWGGGVKGQWWRRWEGKAGWFCRLGGWAAFADGAATLASAGGWTPPSLPRDRTYLRAIIKCMHAMMLGAGWRGRAA
jgi:hypothetical protein